MVIKQPNNPHITVFCAFTREWALEKWLRSFDALKIPRRFTELVFYVDTPGDIADILASYFRESQFNGVVIEQTDNPAPIGTRAEPRRDRIVQQKEKSKKLISPSSKFVFCLADDTTVPPDAFLRLYWILHAQSDVGYVSGVQVGRWGLPYIGAWKMDDIYAPKHVWTVPFSPYGIEYVDGGGFYCYLTTAHLYKSVKYRWEHECFGPDVCYVLDLRRRGWRALIDWSIHADHHVSPTKTLRPQPGCVSLKWNLKGGKWEMDKVPPFRSL